MRKQFVQLTSQGARAYYLAQRAQRKEAAEYYRDHPEMLLSGVAAKFGLPMSSMRKGLAENGIETDRSRQYGRKQHRLTCPSCRKIVFHACKVEASATPKPGERVDPRWIHPVTGRPIDRTPEAIAYLERAMPYEPPATSPATASGDGSASILPGDTPEMIEHLLSLDELMERGRKELGIG